ncbi:Excinuclease ABC subunit C [Microbacterium sp. Nx66]|nr:Excinuclease ABC subunit C [Microbacterium sp. Nx66]
MRGPGGRGMSPSSATPHASDSAEQRMAEQRMAERAIVAAVAEQLGVALTPARIAIDDAHMEIDGRPQTAWSSWRPTPVSAHSRVRSPASSPPTRSNSPGPVRSSVRPGSSSPWLTRRRPATCIARARG